MKLTLLAIGQRPPKWVVDGFEFYRRRMPSHLPLELVELPGTKTGKNMSSAQVRVQEAGKITSRIPKGAHTLALEMTGSAWTTQQLSEQLQSWQMKGVGVALMIGGAEGLDPDLLSKAQQTWSLGPLTLPHALVRVVVAEQIYRAWSMLSNHPYHRA